VQFTDVLVA